jgi:hypothetical protein
MALSRVKHVGEAQKGIWNICFSKLCKPSSQPLPIVQHLALDPRREVRNKYKQTPRFLAKSMLLEQRLMGGKQALGVIKPEETAFLTQTCVAEAFWCISLLWLSSFQFILHMVVTFLKHKSNCSNISVQDSLEITFASRKRSDLLTWHSKLSGPHHLSH